MNSRHRFSDDYSDTTDDYSGDETLEVESTESKSSIHGGAFRRGVLLAWEQVYLLACITGMFIDPLFFYILSIRDSWMCVFIDGWFAITVTVVRCMTDALHVANMWLQFKWNRWSRYDVGSRHDDRNSCNVSRKAFMFDLFVILPIPQVYQTFDRNYYTDKSIIILIHVNFRLRQNLRTR
ncbi:cyclic nucleotide-gated ion channel 4-like [Lactuca sativa]|uniref:cyclic nucleotide-gated ion channel 4-like n=1 Tax=Lactuca sativa TaxID=4236 RepID=UPI001C691B8E|nr:cyclic nucleotide-gated ion channel 4-like [Lactuca sativa]